MSQPALVCVLDRKATPLNLDVDIEKKVLGSRAEVVLVYLDAPDALPEPVFNADALIVGYFARLSEPLVRKLRRARVIIRNGVGYDNIDAEAAWAAGIPVCNVPDYCTEEVADHTLMLVLALERRLREASQAVRDGQWTWQAAVPVRRLRGQRFGVVGCGRIGSAVALRAKALGFEVQFFDPYVRSGHEKSLGVGRTPSLDALLASSDVVSLHTPLTKETAGIIGELQVAAMKPGAILINTARGPLIQEKALVGALKSGRLAGAGLDVLESEPNFDPELSRHPNCIITPHDGFYSEQSLYDVREISAQIVRDVLDGKPPVNVVNAVGAAAR